MLAGGDLVPFTANAFVMGEFHGPGVKESVYRPTWHDRERLDFTIEYAQAMASLRGPGHRLSLSTVPGSFKLFDEGPGAVHAMAVALATAAKRLRGLEDSAGTRVVLGLEPEPLCTLETVEEVIGFFRGPLRNAFGRERAALHHLGVCYDVCHQAVEGEDPVDALARLAQADIPVVKVQASSALEIPDPSDPAARAALARFAEPRWLHQVVCDMGAGGHQRAADLPVALEGPDAERWAASGHPWRVHFHVPVHREEAVPPLKTTRADLERALVAIAEGGVTEHLEIETYTWDALPAEARADSLVESLAREYEWVLSVLLAAGCRRADAS